MKNVGPTTSETATTLAPQGAHVEPQTASSKKGATRRKTTPSSQKAAKGGKPGGTIPKKEAKGARKAAKSASTKESRTPRPESKGAKILNLISRAKGATLTEIMKATDWQAHSVRGFLSTAGKKQNLQIESSKNEAGGRVYRMTK